MLEIKGNYTNAIIYCDELDEASISQIYQVCNQKKHGKLQDRYDAGCPYGIILLRWNDHSIIRSCDPKSCWGRYRMWYGSSEIKRNTHRACSFG